jgi:hypothetical protein
VRVRAGVAGGWGESMRVLVWQVVPHRHAGEYIGGLAILRCARCKRYVVLTTPPRR